MDDTPRKPYATDLSDERWALIEPTLTAWRAERMKNALEIVEPVYDLREIVNAILYQERAGCAWHLLPHDLPHYKSVFRHFAAWRDDGTTQKIHDELRRKVRKSADRDPEPTCANLDAQSVKTSTNVPAATQGADNGKKIVGRKRHIASDTLGLILFVMVTAASLQDTPAGIQMIQRLAADHPSVALVRVDQGYKRSVIDEGAKNGIRVEDSQKDPTRKGFTPTPRWMAERLFGWLMLHRRLARDYETRPESSISHIQWSMIDNMSRRLTGETTPTWRNNAPVPDIPLPM